ncbi:unnamed protein product [Phytomonas sp. Hart1]|nr:unnamed protein product [Phytomonas sp. Hart1]|eukprot:CCW69466.1 unnamed protein product [Phytomonas sp. isolate Hart1]
MEKLQREMHEKDEALRAMYEDAIQDRDIRLAQLAEALLRAEHRALLRENAAPARADGQMARPPPLSALSGASEIALGPPEAASDRAAVEARCRELERQSAAVGLENRRLAMALSAADAARSRQHRELHDALRLIESLKTGLDRVKAELPVLLQRDPGLLSG